MPNRIQRFWQELRTTLAHRYRFIIMDEVSYRNSLQITLSLQRILAAVVALAALVFFTTATVIVFTPVREWIPGYTDPELHTKQRALLLKLDTMETLVVRQDSFIRSLQRVSGYTPADSQALQRALPAAPEPAPQAPPGQPRLNRNDAPATPGATFVPVRMQAVAPILWVHPVTEGQISQGYAPGQGHVGLDIAARAGAPVVAAADGVVILDEFTRDRGYVLGLQHRGGWVSFYKHNQANLTQGLGSLVEGGEVIALVGNTGEHSSGPHLHFELWWNGRPLDPRLYLPTDRLGAR